jgi:hypothetical protein
LLARRGEFWLDRGMRERKAKRNVKVSSKLKAGWGVWDYVT